MKMPLGVMEVVVALLVVTLLSLLSRILQRFRPHPDLKLPPTPFFSLPLLGHVFHLRNVTSHALVTRLCQKLGPIFTLYAGSTPIVSITSAALTHEALVQKGLLFASRPLLASRAPLSNNFRFISFAPYGPYWRAVRRNLVHEMLDMPKILSSFKPARALVLDHLISHILTEAQKNEGIISFFHIIEYAMFELASFMCFGFYMPKDVLLQFIAMVDELLTLSAPTLDDFYPLLRVFTWRKRQAEKALLAKQVKLFTTQFQKHQELQKLGQLAPGSYLETLLHMNASTPLSTDDLIMLCTEFFVAITDTTVTTLEWIMANLVEEISIQSNLYDQIQDVVGDRLVEEKDLPNLPYLHAVIKETLRLHPPSGLLMPHSVSELCELGGYDIPPNAIVIFYLTTISRDAQIWEEPLRFKPERFATVDVDIIGSKDVKMLPFGIGRRMCPGLSLANMHMELIAARLVQAIKWTKFPAGKAVDLTEGPVFTLKMKHPLKAFVKERKAY